MSALAPACCCVVTVPPFSFSPCQRSIPKGHDLAVSRLRENVESIKDEKEEMRRDGEIFERKNKKKPF